MSLTITVLERLCGRKVEHDEKIFNMGMDSFTLAQAVIELEQLTEINILEGDRLQTIETVADLMAVYDDHPIS